VSLRAVVLCAVGFVLLYGLFTIGFPFLLALLGAIFLEPLVTLSMKYLRFHRMVASALVCTWFTALLLGFVYLLGFKIVSEVIQLWNHSPAILNGARLFYDDTSERTRLFYDSLPLGVAEQLQGILESGITSLAESVKDVLTAVSMYFLNVAKAIPNMLVFVVVFIISLYLMSFQLPGLYQSFLNVFDKSSRPKVARVLTDLRRALVGFLFAQTLISFLTFLVTAAGLLFLRVDYPLAIALVIILVDILPILGTSAVFVPWIIYCLLAGNTQLAVGLLILLLFIMIFRRLIEPKIIGEAVGIHALAALISMYIGFQLFGVIGLVLGPVVIIIYQALRRVGLLHLTINLDKA
jgi:sporulation integral membrane protein YtvI